MRTSELWIYNNSKHWALKQGQVMFSFAPPGTTGWPVLCDGSILHGKAGFTTVAVRAFPQTVVLMQPFFMKVNARVFLLALL